MLASQATRLLQRGQAAQAALFPSSIVIDGQTYENVGTSGIRRADVLGDGGFQVIRSISFWLSVAAVEGAGKPQPTAGAAVQCTAPVSFAGVYRLASVALDPAGVNLILACTAAPQ